MATVLILIVLVFLFSVVVGAGQKPNLMLICPHCNTKGQVRTQQVKNKKGISGGKATAALLTGGVSILVTGLSRKEKATKASCGACKSVWHY